MNYTTPQKNNLAKQYFEIIKIWAMAQGIKVKQAKYGNSKFYPDTKTITINKRICDTTKLAHLIHECGHFVSHSKYSIPDRFDITYNRLIVLKDEITAWESGFELCAKLGLDISMFNFKAVESNSLKTYCSWVLNPSKWKI